MASIITKTTSVSSRIPGFSVRTPTVSYEGKQQVEKNAEWQSGLKTRVASIVLDKLSNNINAAREREIAILATFFQRVVARTPIDEDYKVVHRNKKGEETVREHKKDTSVCQDDWYITDGNITLTARQLKTIDSKLFWNVNEKYSVEQIKKIFNEKFVINDKTKFTIGNNNPHFKSLEEGYYKWKNDGKSASKDIKAGVHREHGVQNMHSIQAPVGMWRISMAELEVMKNSKVASSLTSRYRAQYGRIMRKPPNKSKLESFMKLLQPKRNIAWKDIERYIERY